MSAPAESLAPAPQDWTAPGAFEVAPGVHRIPLPLPSDALRAINVYVLTDPGNPDRCVLIDSGWALVEARTALEGALASIGHDLGTVDRFLITHFHRDHYTLGIELQRTLGTRVAIGIGEEPNVVRSMEAGGLSEAAGMLPLWGAACLIDGWREAYPVPDRIVTSAAYGLPDEWITPDDRLQVGDRTLHAIPTPGHTRGHLVFLDATAGLLFSGDHVLPHITPSIGFESARTPDPLGDFLGSLQLLMQHPDARILPAHGAPAPSVHRRVKELMDHHELRLAHTLDAVTAGAGTAFQAARRIGWTRRCTPFDDLTVLNQVLATGETAAHLVVLADRGLLVAETDESGVQSYRVADTAGDTPVIS